MSRRGSTCNPTGLIQRTIAHLDQNSYPHPICADESSGATVRMDLAVDARARRALGDLEVALAEMHDHGRERLLPVRVAQILRLMVTDRRRARLMGAQSSLDAIAVNRRVSTL